MFKKLLFLLFLMANIPSTAQVIVEMRQKNGVFVVPCKVNGIPMDFVFDTGASDVSISAVEAIFMLKNGLLKADDFIGTEYYRIANGDVEEGMVIRLREIEIGGIKIENVKAAVSHSITADLLLGQSAIQRLGPIQLNGNKLIILNQKEKTTQQKQAANSVAVSNIQSGWTTEEIKKANTAEKTTYLTPEERNVILYTNLARMYPQKYAKLEVEPYDGGAEFGHYLVGSSYKASLLRELQTRAPIGPVYPDIEMYKHAKCWAVESGKQGITGHNRITCAYPSDCWAENCSYGRPDGRHIVLQLLIDHDVPSLGHRKNILDKTIVTAGASIQPHTKYRYCCVVNYGCSKYTSSFSNNDNKSAYARRLLIAPHYYQRNGVNFMSLLSIAYYYGIRGNDAFCLSVFGFRHRKFQMEILSAELEQTIETIKTGNIRIALAPKMGALIPISRQFAIGTYSGLVVPPDVCQNIYQNYNIGESIRFKEMLQQCQLPIGISFNFRNAYSIFTEYRHPLSKSTMYSSNLLFGIKLQLGIHWN